jgi:hypothetical protein
MIRRDSAGKQGDPQQMTLNFEQLQSEQYSHDKRNHFDILSLSKTDRLKHYGLHYAKYVGRFARGSSEPKTIKQTLVDAFLVSLSAANTLHQKLWLEVDEGTSLKTNDAFLRMADATGRFADACEKIDHMEEFVPQARVANIDFLSVIIAMAASEKTNLSDAVKERRKILASKQFFIKG